MWERLSSKITPNTEVISYLPEPQKIIFTLGLCQDKMVPKKFIQDFTSIRSYKMLHFYLTEARNYLDQEPSDLQIYSWTHQKALMLTKRIEGEDNSRIISWDDGVKSMFHPLVHSLMETSLTAYQESHNGSPYFLRTPFSETETAVLGSIAQLFPNNVGYRDIADKVWENDQLDFFNARHYQRLNIYKVVTRINQKLENELEIPYKICGESKDKYWVEITG